MPKFIPKRAYEGGHNYNQENKYYDFIRQCYYKIFFNAKVITILKIIATILK